MSDTLLISTPTELLRLPAENVLFISSDGNYSILMMINNESRMVNAQLGQIEALIDAQIGRKSQLVRLGKSLIVNLNYVHFINVPRQQLILSDCKMATHTQTVSKEVLKNLKEMLEKANKNI
jgi:DNA-binding LytR/AlgR family response regulator